MGERIRSRFNIKTLVLQFLDTKEKDDKYLADEDNFLRYKNGEIDLKAKPPK